MFSKNSYLIDTFEMYCINHYANYLSIDNIGFEPMK